jgi:uncharacterized 2Fe-2S/4Fe-4S cluster protein (DUF4445 family)
MMETAPWIRKISPEISPPSLSDNTGDVDRLLKGLRKKLNTNDLTIRFSLIPRLPRILRTSGFRVDVVLFQKGAGWQVIEVFPAAASLPLHGISVDLGSSTVVVRLLDLLSGEIREESSFHNPQLEIGADILTRIHFASQPGGLDRLQCLIREKLNGEIRMLAGRRKIDPASIFGMSLAGNTVMTHLFLGLDPHWLCREPYIPVLNRPDLLSAQEIGLAIHPSAPVLLFPNVGSYFGGDLIAGIIASGMNERNEISILVDVGTNAEVVIGNRDWLMACAGAAGPALEGGVARMGMMAGPGVIDKVRIDSHTGKIEVKTIGNLPPIGICGSGLIDLTAQLFLRGMIDLRGKFVPRTCGDLLIETDEIRQLIIVPAERSGTGRPLTLGQPDIDSLIRSKAAMYTILTTLTHTVNIPMGELKRFFIAGTFGSFIDPESAITIGMIPDLPLESYVPLGNTSLEGATMALLSGRVREEISHIRDRITYMELNVNQEFMLLFSAAKFLPHTDRSLFPSVKVNGSPDEAPYVPIDRDHPPL